MKAANALEVRRSLGKMLTRLDEGGGPIVLERNGKPAAVLISLQAFRERFAELDAAEERNLLVDEILKARRSPPRPGLPTAVEEVRSLRGPLP